MPVNWTAPLNQMGLNTHGQMMGSGRLWRSSRLGKLRKSNRDGAITWPKGRPGMFGGLLNIGKGTLSRIGNAQ